MWIIIGLGNPGKAYINTRHNLGFMVIDALSSKFSAPLTNKSKNFVYSPAHINSTDVILMKPLTFMNRSGIAVREALKKYRETDGFIVIHDDLDLSTGVIRIRKSGSAGGHNGIESIINHINSKDFLRLKIGIGRSVRIPAEDYVLRNFSRLQKPAIKNAVEKAVDAIATILDKGVSTAQNRFHRD